MRPILRHVTRVAYLVGPGLLIVSVAWCLQHALPWDVGDETLTYLALVSPSLLISILTVALAAGFHERSFFRVAPLVSFAFAWGLLVLAGETGWLPYRDACHAAPVGGGLFFAFILQASTLAAALFAWLASRKRPERPPET